MTNRNKQISHSYFRCLLILSCIVLVSTDFSQNANADSPKTPNWQPLQIINVQDFPWDENPRFKSKSKTIFRGPNGSSMIYSLFAPRWCASNNLKVHCTVGREGSSNE